MPPPVDSMDSLWAPNEHHYINNMTQVSVVGAAQTVREGLMALLEETGADEIMRRRRFTTTPRVCVASRFWPKCAIRCLFAKAIWLKFD